MWPFSKRTTELEKYIQLNDLIIEMGKPKTNDARREELRRELVRRVNGLTTLVGAFYKEHDSNVEPLISLVNKSHGETLVVVIEYFDIKRRYSYTREQAVQHLKEKYMVGGKGEEIFKRVTGKTGI